MVKAIRFTVTVNSLFLCLLLITGCVGKQVTLNQYTLTRIADQSLGGETFKETRQVILVGPVALPALLKRTGIVTRPDDTATVKTSDTHLWAGPLEEQIATTVVDELATLLGTSQTAVYPGPRFSMTRYQVELEFHRFDGAMEREFTCDIIWTISDTTARTILVRRDFSSTTAIDRPGYSGYVDSASQAVHMLSKTIAQALLTLAADNEKPSE